LNSKKQKIASILKSLRILKVPQRGMSNISRTGHKAIGCALIGQVFVWKSGGEMCISNMQGNDDPICMELFFL